MTDLNFTLDVEGDGEVPQHPDWLSWVVDGDEGIVVVTRDTLLQGMRYAQRDYNRALAQIGTDAERREQAEVNFRSEINALESRLQASVTEAQRVRRDIETIAEALRNEAMRREWCNEYGDFIDEVNSNTSQEWLMHCFTTESRTYIVEVTVSGRPNNMADAWSEITNDLASVASELDTDVDEATSNYYLR